MFKFFLFIALCVSLLYYSFQTAENPRLEVLGTGEYCFYSTDTVESNLITKRIDTGFSYIYFCDSRDAEKLRGLFSAIDGESITLSSRSANARELLKIMNYQKVSENNDGVIDTVYGFSGHGKAFIKQGAQKINLQVAARGNTVTVGWPVILGSY